MTMAELELDHAISAYLRHGRDTPGSKVLS